MSDSRAEVLGRLLGLSAARAYFPLVDQITEQTQAARYTFLDQEEFVRLAANQPSAGMKVYWTEMLYRAHISAAVSIRRSRAWLDAVVDAQCNRNAMATAAGLRGFIESAADSNDSLSQVPLTIASTASNIRSALSGTLETGVVNPELEDKLVHFAYARKLRGKDPTPQQYHAKSAAEYMAEFTWFNAPRVLQLYSQLCEYVHAAAPSVHVFLSTIDEGLQDIVTHKRDPELDLPSDLASSMERVAILALTPPLLVLAVLNFFALPELHTPAATSQVCSGVPMWAKIERALGVI